MEAEAEDETISSMFDFIFRAFYFLRWIYKQTHTFDEMNLSCRKLREQEQASEIVLLLSGIKEDKKLYKLYPEMQCNPSSTILGNYMERSFNRTFLNPNLPNATQLLALETTYTFRFIWESTHGTYTTGTNVALRYYEWDASN